MISNATATVATFRLGMSFVFMFILRFSSSFRPTKPVVRLFTCPVFWHAKPGTDRAYVRPFPIHTIRQIDVTLSNFQSTYALVVIAIATASSGNFRRHNGGVIRGVSARFTSILFPLLLTSK